MLFSRNTATKGEREESETDSYSNWLLKRTVDVHDKWPLNLQNKYNR